MRTLTTLGGSYGIRPMHNAMNLSGALPQSSLFDTAGYDNGPVPANKSFKSFPRKVLYPVGYLPLDNPQAPEVFDNFISQMTQALGMTTEKINITSILSNSSNPYTNKSTLTESLFSTAVKFDSWNTRNAYSNPDTVTQKDYNDVIARQAEFRKEKFLNDQLDAGYLYMTKPKQWLNPLLISPLLSSPQIDIPIGQVDYQSAISLQTEKLSIVMDLMAAPRCDGMLFKLVETLAEKGLPNTVKTGRTAF
ncbi:unnamed protein product [Clonostachys rosea]|uniref:Amidase domain-containing protein n=1 Tax=Bionectria ochroleuca TaxID=29856 RepID=A0ABY6U7V4_BIOOC|nr:unnamed protein product [Clonostachys rosea]